MINNLAYTPILRYSDTRNSLAPNTVSAKSQRTGLTVKPDVAEDFAGHVIARTVDPFRYIGTEYTGNNVSIPSVFDSDPRMPDIVVKSIQTVLDDLLKLPDHFELVQNPEFIEHPDSFDLKESASSTPFFLKHKDGSAPFKDPFLYNTKPMGISYSDESPQMFIRIYPFLDEFLKKNQSEKTTKAIPAFALELIREETMKALLERGLIRKSHLDLF